MAAVMWRVYNCMSYFLPKGDYVMMYVILSMSIHMMLIVLLSEIRLGAVMWRVYNCMSYFLPKGDYVMMYVILSMSIHMMLIVLLSEISLGAVICLTDYTD